MIKYGFKLSLSLPAWQTVGQSLHFIQNLTVTGGKPFIAPLIAGGVLPNLLSALSVTTPPRIVTESLRALSVIVAELGEDLIGEYHELRDSAFEQIGATALGDFGRILAEDVTSRHSDTQFTLVLHILQGLCRDSVHTPGLLVSTGMLDLLASKLTAWIVTNQPEFKSNDHESLYQIRSPPKSSYPDLVTLIALIVQDSHYYCARLFYSRDIVAIFPTVPKFSSSTAPTSAEPLSALSGRSWEAYLPKITPAPSRADASSKAFPALGYEAAHIPFVDSGAMTFGSNKNIKDSHSDLLAWLGTMARHTDGRSRISTLFLFANLLRFTDLHIRHERALAFLMIPILVRLIEEDRLIDDNSIQYGPGIFPETILATIIRGSNPLQLAAYEADAIKTLCGHLKRLFEPVSDPPAAMWSPSKIKPVAKYSLKDACLSGPPVMSHRLAKILDRRAAIMNALSALTQLEDVARKEIIKNGIIQVMVDALTPYPERLVPDGSYIVVENVDPKDGNPNNVLTGMLDMLRSLSRSVNILRTSLIDGGVAKPVYNLLRHKSLDVKIAATKVACNLILQFSPMKDVSVAIFTVITLTM
jgi:armadillo repeat-containing protein 8